MLLQESNKRIYSPNHFLALDIQQLGTAEFERTSSLRGSVASGEYCATVDTEV
jgi:hypothetical protein